MIAARKSSPAPRSRKSLKQTPTITVRIDAVTHGVLMNIAEELDTTMTSIIRDAVRHYRNRQLHNLAAQQLAELCKDPEAWDDFLGGEEHWPEFDHIRAS